LKTHPSIDSVMLNAGTQSRSNFANPESVDLSAFHREITINFSALVSLVHAVLPHFLARTAPTGLIFTGTQISLVPAFLMPAYSASKAALDSFIMCLREQLRDSNVKVQHISPGPVATEFHPDFGMPISDFMSEAWTGLVEGKTDIFPGTVGGSTKEQFLEIVSVREAAVDRMSGVLRKVMG
jgi:short-subunit dehydrogenase